MPERLAADVAGARASDALPKHVANDRGLARPTVSVVIPAKNEARNLSHVFASIPAWVDEIVLVDGHSSDDTVAVARKLNPEVKIVAQEGQGKGDALRVGFAACESEIIVMMDADGSTDGKEIPGFFEALVAGADFAKGSRFVRGAGSDDITATRRCGNWVLITLVNLLFGTRYTDLCYGYNALWARHVQLLELDCDGFEIESVMNIRAAKAGLRVQEVPSHEHARVHGHSNLHVVRDGWRIAKVIAREVVRRRTCKRLPQMRMPVSDVARDRFSPGTWRSGSWSVAEPHKERVVVVGSGLRFASGISHYTYLLASTLTSEYDVGALLMRRLVPQRLYPGRNHVGAGVAGSVVYPPEVSVYDGVDWYWGRSLTGALQYLDEIRPTVVIFEWWTGAVLHTYLRLARQAARLGARIILEWHEGQDVGEAAMPIARGYVQTLMPRLLSLVDAHVVHSEFDLQAIPVAYSLGNAIVRVMPHGPYHHVVSPAGARDDASDNSPFRLLYFGVIRSYKGVEDLIEAFSLLDHEQARQFRLSVVGETWEGCTAPDEAIARSAHADLIERVARYVSDEELADYVGRADAIVLPYRRSSLSGPLFIAMTAGLPTVVTAVGGLPEVVEDYAGAILVPPQDPVALRDALLKLPALRGERYPNPRSWQQTMEGYRELIDDLRGRAGSNSALPFRAIHQAGS